tara:strand:- start:11056 stop:12873 length:1818 start_codon:yes stop_codon:yes gene_type:complete
MNLIIQRAKQLIELVEEEQKTQLDRWNENESNLKVLRSSGELMFPLKINKYNFSVNNSPTLEVSYPNYYNERLFDRGTSILIFDEEQNKCKGMLSECDDQNLSVQLYLDDFPEWVYENKIGIIPHADEKTFRFMLGILNSIVNEKSALLVKHLQSIYNNDKNIGDADGKTELKINDELNDSQKKAVERSLGGDRIVTIQGPPGTGKTTTLVEVIQQLKANKQKVIASAPSNTAVDHLATKLIDSGIKILRLGNEVKVSDDLLDHTPNGILAQPNNQKQLKKLKAQVNELRKKASQFKRSFTAEDRENRKKWRAEAREINKEIRSLSNYIISKHIEEADVILGTPVGLCDSSIKEIKFDVGIIDEAGQCLTPLGFLVMDNAKRVILCGDQKQLPPTVISKKAKKNGLDRSILEEALQQNEADVMLDLQYRMPPVIADFSAIYFYDGKLRSAKKNTEDHLDFYDTSGAGFKEVKDENGSIFNPEEIEMVTKIIEEQSIKDATFISPYAAQVRRAKSTLPKNINCSTIDGFQGQEDDVIIISLVRNNEEGEIGFLSDYRRMNVAMTRARKKLIVIGDSATLGGNEFFGAFISHCEEQNVYRSVFELMY